MKILGRCVKIQSNYDTVGVKEGLFTNGCKNTKTCPKCNYRNSSFSSKRRADLMPILSQFVSCNEIKSTMQ